MTRLVALSIFLLGVLLAACDEEAAVVPPSTAPRAPRTVPREAPAIESLSTRSEVVADPGPAVDNGGGGGGGAGTKTLSLAERTRGRRTSLTEEILLDSARAAEPSRADEPCEEAYQSTVAILEQMRARDGEGRYPRPDRANFMTGCRSHPPAMQRCLAPSYFRGNTSECQRVLGVRGANATPDVPQAEAAPSEAAP
jgi:hypothetical protein